MSTRISSLSIRTTVALDDVTVLEALDVGVLLGEQLLHRRRLGAEVARRGRRRGLVLVVGGGRRVGGVVAVELGRGGIVAVAARPRRRGGLGVGSGAGAAIGSGRVRRLRSSPLRLPRHGGGLGRRWRSSAEAARRSLGGSGLCLGHAARWRRTRLRRGRLSAVRRRPPPRRRARRRRRSRRRLARASGRRCGGRLGRARPRPSVLRSRFGLSWSMMSPDTKRPEQRPGHSETIRVVRG